MSKIKYVIRNYFILSKRLLCKKSFVAILLLVPLLVGAMGIFATGNDSGVITVALAMEDSEDKIANEIIKELVEEGSLIRFVVCDDPSEAVYNVETAKADAAWFLNDRLEDRIVKFAQHTNDNNAFVTVVQREESVFLRLSHEKLNSTLYPYISLALFSESVKEKLSNTSEEEMEQFYYSVNAEGEDLFEFVYASEYGEDKAKEGSEDEGGFLLSPLRGLLAIMVLIGGVAVSMFYMQDESRGLFDRFPRGAGFFFSIIYHIAAVVMVGFVVLVSLILTRMSVGLGYELLVMAVYCIATVGFCMCMRLILRDIRIFSSVAPVLVVVTVVLCPILITAPKIPVIQYLLPTYYYMSAFSNVKFVPYMIAYSASLYVLTYLLHKLKTKSYK